MNVMNKIVSISDAIEAQAETEFAVEAAKPTLQLVHPVQSEPTPAAEAEVTAQSVETSTLAANDDRQPVPAVPTVTTSAEAADPVGAVSSIPDGYALFSDGVYQMPSDEEGEPVFICSPLRVDALFADQDGRGWGRLVVVRDDDGRWHDVPVLNADLTRRAAEVLARLHDCGLVLGVGKGSKDRLLQLLQRWKPQARLTSVSRLGWAGETFDSFVIGSDVIGDAKVLPMPALGNGPARHLVQKGTIDTWRSEIGRKCDGNPLMMLAVSLAFSGPLLALLGEIGGGLHFRGTSSSGKTTLLRLAASVWGSRELIGQWRATSNGLETTAAALNDMLLPLDEIAEISPRALHEAIYMLANGKAKSRMTKDATLADTASWRLAIISSGEISVEEKLKEARLDAKTGHEVRLIDIEADTRTWGVFDILHDAKNAAAFADMLRNAANACHGAVGREFVRRLSKLTRTGFATQIEALVRALASSWVGTLPSAPDGQIQRVARRFAIIAVAGRLATGMKLTGWSDDAAVEAARTAFLDWYERRFGEKREAVDTVVEPLKTFLDNELATLSPLRGDQTESNLHGWRDDTRAYLTAETWARLYPETEGARAAKALLDMQMLLPGEGGRTMRRASRHIPGRPRLYTLNLERIDAYKIS
ncbi:uncharacterized protein (DUF927 family) [Rhodobacter viridis]|uniref:Uncharacterized protein (DUF927 family) n=2 Tax=Rhodobacter viridis TaxID=1054202 RepID=A0A318U488_9RHOB|nr:uncharacterized protein (DUF927 family) [Rhodobacter viridis]